MRRLIPAALLIGSLGLAPAAQAQPVTLINVFDVPQGALEPTIRFWETSRDFLARQPGYHSTRLHQAILPDARFQLINVAVWESPEAFQAAARRMQAELRVPPPPGLAFHAALYRVVRE